VNVTVPVLVIALPDVDVVKAMATRELPLISV
jgi:hypothetical protein